MMSGDLAIFFSKQMLWQAMLVSLPVVSVSLICGLFISVLQAATQIQDSTLSFIPKLLAAVLMLMFCSGWMLHQLTEYARQMITHIPEVLR
ncbi:flagellar biosynthesis protein FliQ [Legionella israelensis]|uniref:Flagellar biosynthetic protein FliQ n=2 Tax=Legionella israelensis TaxID=454 RepID=A0A0W0VU07_9GAMM|nr:flagellar biosynthesis protein FliQ [Legionella israelensis]KTD23732.1 flagellar biosynthetic protein FliQ [Legionella israelensis]SCX80395.1 flagellar biosynthetic protein FliQ [Legionella israelensis DSM 19235]STX57874.1 flagellar biosynthetic protein FliQ [Legionella israelensis]